MPFARATSRLRPRRALLYFPAHSEKFLKKALKLNVDVMCLDLEDSITLDRKLEARKGAVKAINSVKKNSFELAVRINSRHTSFGQEDLQEVLSQNRLPDAIVMPKVESKDDIAWFEETVQNTAGDAARNLRLLTLIESPKAVLNMPEILDTGLDRIEAVIFGADDYCAACGATRTVSNHEVAHPRAQLLMQAQAHGVQAIDIVNINYKDSTQLIAESKQAFEMGYSGKQVIHPDQVGPVQEAFSPSPERILWAEKVVAAYKQHGAKGSGAFELDGDMIDMPTIRIALNVLEMSQEKS